MISFILSDRVTCDVKSQTTYQGIAKSIESLEHMAVDAMRQRTKIPTVIPWITHRLGGDIFYELAEL